MPVVNGSNRGDTLFGSNEADIINGLDGNDTLKGFGGADRFDGGAGIDTVIYGDSNTGIGINLSAGRGFGGSAEGDTFISIENVFGSAFNDSLIGNNGANELVGLSGADVLKGGGGADLLDGGDDDDILKGGGGADRLIGGSGVDTADYSQSIDNVSIDLGAGTAHRGDAEGDVLIGIENVTGTNSVFSDVLTGDAGANTLVALDGDDFLQGGLGADILVGGRGNDVYDLLAPGDTADIIVENAGEGLDVVFTHVTYVLAPGCEIELLSDSATFSTAAIDLVGNEFGQTIDGNYGQNTIVGGGGADILTGRAGGDVFVWTSTADGSVSGFMDVITDFNRLEGDLVAVNPIDADETVAGNQAFTFIGTGPFTAPGQVRFFTTATTTFIEFNTDSDTTLEMTIGLNGVHNVDASWFVL